MQRLHADPPDPPQIAQPRHADDQAGKDQRYDKQQQQSQEERPDRVGDLIDDERQIGSARAHEAVQRPADQRPEDQTNQNFRVKRNAPHGLSHGGAWYTSGGVGSSQ